MSPERGLGLGRGAALAGALALGGLVVGGAWLVLRGPSAPDSSARTQCLGAGERVVVTGETTSYIKTSPAMLVPNSAAMSAAGLGGFGESLEQTITESWTLDLRGVGAHPDGGFVVAMELTLRELSLGGEIQPTPPKPPVQLVGLDSRCKITSFGWQEELPLGPARRVQLLVSEFSFALPAQGGLLTGYHVGGADSTGDHSTRFTLSGDRLDGEMLTYSKLRIDGGSGGVRARLLAGEVSVEDPGTRWFGSLRRDREVSIGGLGGEVMRIRVQVDARTAPGSASVDAPVSGWAWGSLLDRKDASFGLALGTAQEEATRDANAVDPAALERAVDGWLAIFADGIDAGGNYASRVQALAAFLAANPEAAAPLLARLTGGELDEVFGARGAAFLAVGLADVPQTRAALLSVIGDDETSMGYRLNAAIALSTSKVPEDGLVEALEGWMGDPELDEFGRGSAYLALGGLSNRKGADYPDLQARISERIVADLTDPEVSENNAAFALDAAGNSGDGALAPAVANFLDEEKPEMRVLATEAMRQMPPEAVGDYLSGVLRNDLDPTVQAAALRALGSSHRGVALPEGVVTTVFGRIEGTDQTQYFRGGVGFLGQAAQVGNSEATDGLLKLWEREMARQPLDVDRLRALGAFVGPDGLR